MLFTNRMDAARQLAEKLAPYSKEKPLVLAIPRGAVPMAYFIAHSLKGELDVVLVRKLGAPNQPELAVGAVDESGEVYLHPYAEQLHLSQNYLEGEKEDQIETLRERRASYTPHRPPIPPEGRVVIIVDDGIATGSTMSAAIHAIRAKKPKKIIVAVGVAPPDTIRRLKGEADEVVCLATPDPFYAVGQFFQDFSQVSDSEVIKLLEEGEQNLAVSN